MVDVVVRCMKSVQITVQPARLVYIKVKFQSVDALRRVELALYTRE